MRITVLSTFDVWPPRDGGQARYVNLWRNFSHNHEITILVYEFRNTVVERHYKLGDHIEVVVPIASESDARHFHYMMQRTGLWLHDVLCLADYMFSHNFLTRLGKQLESCDVLVASHPYLAKVAFPMAREKTALVYESHNVEFDIKADYFRASRDRDVAHKLLEAVKHGESYAARRADLVTAVSHKDLTRLVELYKFRSEKATIVPNGANIRTVDLLQPEERSTVLHSLGLGDKLVGIFLGSAFAANVESYKRGRDMLEDAGFRGTMLLVGSIDQTNRDDWRQVSFTEIWLGFVDERVRDVLLSAAHFAFHLMFSGAGTNLKLFDYMGAGIPIITNEFGRRGVQHTGWCLEAEDASELAQALANLREQSDLTLSISSAARQIALRDFDWRRIAKIFEETIATKLPWASPAESIYMK